MANYAGLMVQVAWVTACLAPEISARPNAQIRLDELDVYSNPDKG